MMSSLRGPSGRFRRLRRNVRIYLPKSAHNVEDDDQAAFLGKAWITWPSDKDMARF